MKHISFSFTGCGMIQQDIFTSSAYYVALGNLNSELMEVTVVNYFTSLKVVDSVIVRVFGTFVCLGNNGKKRGEIYIKAIIYLMPVTCIYYQFDRGIINTKINESREYTSRS